MERGMRIAAHGQLEHSSRLPDDVPDSRCPPPRYTEYPINYQAPAGPTEINSDEGSDELDSNYQLPEATDIDSDELDEPDGPPRKRKRRQSPLRQLKPEGLAHSKYGDIDHLPPPDKWLLHQRDIYGVSWPNITSRFATSFCHGRNRKLPSKYKLRRRYEKLHKKLDRNAKATAIRTQEATVVRETVKRTEIGHLSPRFPRESLDGTVHAFPEEISDIPREPRLRWTNSEMILLGMAWYRFRTEKPPWKSVARYFPHRSEGSLKAKFNDFARPTSRHFAIPGHDARHLSFMKKVAGNLIRDADSIICDWEINAYERNLDEYKIPPTPGKPLAYPIKLEDEEEILGTESRIKLPKTKRGFWGGLDGFSLKPSETKQEWTQPGYASDDTEIHSDDLASSPKAGNVSPDNLDDYKESRYREEGTAYAPSYQETMPIGDKEISNASLPTIHSKAKIVVKTEPSSDDESKIDKSPEAELWRTQCWILHALKRITILEEQVERTKQEEVEEILAARQVEAAKQDEQAKEAMAEQVAAGQEAVEIATKDATKQKTQQRDESPSLDTTDEARLGVGSKTRSGKQVLEYSYYTK